MKHGQQDQEPFASELSALATVLTRPSLRKSFSSDPVGTLEHVGVKLDALPAGVVDALAEMSYEELSVVARFNTALADAGLVIGEAEDPGRVGFF